MKMKRILLNLINKIKFRRWIYNHKYQLPVRMNLKTLEIEDLTTINYFDVLIKQSDVSEPGVLKAIFACPYQNGSRIDYRHSYYLGVQSERLKEEFRNIILNENWLLMYGDLITKISVNKKEIENKWITYTLKCEGIAFDSIYDNTKAVHYVDFSVYGKDIPIENIKISAKNRENVLKLIEKNTIK